MKAAILALSLIVSCFSLHGQISSTLNPMPDGSTEIRIRNDAAVSLIAFAIKANDTNDVLGGPLVIYSDAEIDSSTIPVLADQESPIRAGRCVVSRDGKKTCAIFNQGIVTAGIFSDGTTIGDATLLNGLILRRRNMLQAVEVSMELLSDAGRQNVTRDQLIGLFRRLADSLNRWYLPPEQQVGRNIYQSIVEKMTNLPPLQLGSPFPPTAFVAQETALLNRRRVTILESQPSLADSALTRTP